jgi:thiamine-monophosphate kinase
MAREADFINALRALATHPAARSLADDAAVMDGLVYTHDMIAEGVHYLPADPPEDVAWKLLAVNLSDLAAKGATPIAVLMGYALTADVDWDARFIAGLREALAVFNVALIGGDTVALPAGAPRMLGLTAIGRAATRVPSRSGAQVGDAVFVTDTIGDAGLGLRAAKGEIASPALLLAYRRPIPQIEAGQALAPIVSAMMDISDGLLIDAQRLASASGVGMSIDLDAIPLSPDYIACAREDRTARLTAATLGDDYQLLFTSSLPLPKLPSTVTRIGQITRGTGLSLYDSIGAVPLPSSLGWEH